MAETQTASPRTTRRCAAATCRRRLAPGLALAWLVACVPLPPKPAPGPDVATARRTWMGARQAERSLDRAPDAQHFIAPGLQGVFAELRDLPADAPPAPGALTPYTPYRHLATPPDPKRYHLRQLVVKVAQGAAVRLRSGRLSPAPEAATPEQARRLERAGLTPEALQRDLQGLELAVKAAGGTLGRAAPRLDEADLQRLHRRAEATTGREQPDPNLFYFVHLPAGTKPLAAAALLTALRGLGSLETTYFQPIPVNAQVVDQPPTTTTDVTGAQGYFRPAPAGIDVDLASRLPGGDGAGVRVVDVEGGWDDRHEDLPPMAFRFGVNWGDDHGTAVLGEIAAGVNGFGASGIAPAATVGWSSVTNLDPFAAPIYFYSVANALLMSGLTLRAGDIALIEQHFPDLLAGPCPNACNCGQFGFVAVETVPYEHLAISLLTGAGVVVVEAAGNGQTLVTPASPADSGAIVVGASNGDLTPACFSNFGPRVDVHAWGGGIGSLGYGESFFMRVDAAGAPVLDASGNQIFDLLPDPALRANGADATQWYTRLFGGTSGASPIVVGAAALVQSTRLAAGLGRLAPVALRTLLVATGTPQAAGTMPAIGPQPDLARAVAGYLPDAARFVGQAGAPLTVAPGATFSLTTQFDDSGSARWTGGHVMSVAPSFQSGQQEFTGPSLPQGSPAAPVQPGDRVTGPMMVRAPAQPGTYRLVVQLVAPGGVVLARSPAAAVVVAQPNTPIDNASLVVDSAPGSLRDGETGSVTVTATNLGTTTWTTASHRLVLSRGLRISLPLFGKPVAGGVAPGQSQGFTFEVICNGSGQGWFQAQMGGTGGLFGGSAGRTIVCQP